jgi:hypothetical protein
MVISTSLDGISLCTSCLVIGGMGIHGAAAVGALGSSGKHCRSAQTKRLNFSSPGPALSQNLPDGAKLFQPSWRVEVIVEGLGRPWDGEEVARMIFFDSWLCLYLYGYGTAFVIEFVDVCIRAAIGETEVIERGRAHN